MRSSIAIALLLVATAVSASNDEAELEKHFKLYFDSWTPEADISELADQYWDSKATILAPDAVVQLANRAEIASVLTTTMEPVKQDGWQGTAMVAFSSCRLRKGMALVGIDYRRRFADGRETTDRVVYVVRSYDDQWWISAVMSSDSSAIRC